MPESLPRRKNTEESSTANCGAAEASDNPAAIIVVQMLAAVDVWPTHPHFTVPAAALRSATHQHQKAQQHPYKRNLNDPSTIVAEVSFSGQKLAIQVTTGLLPGGREEGGTTGLMPGGREEGGTTGLLPGGREEGGTTGLLPGGRKEGGAHMCELGCQLVNRFKQRSNCGQNPATDGQGQPCTAGTLQFSAHSEPMAPWPTPRSITHGPTPGHSSLRAPV
eukprot:354565-Chlamydomonas_euryale.AAC.2